MLIRRPDVGPTATHSYLALVQKLPDRRASVALSSCRADVGPTICQQLLCLFPWWCLWHHRHHRTLLQTNSIHFLRQLQVCRIFIILFASFMDYLSFCLSFKGIGLLFIFSQNLPYLDRQQSSKNSGISEINYRTLCGFKYFFQPNIQNWIKTSWDNGDGIWFLNKYEEK